MFGDSTVTPAGAKNKELIAKFMADNIIGKTQEEILGIETMHGDADIYTGATVTPNNLVRALISLFDYHNSKY